MKKRTEPKPRIVVVDDAPDFLRLVERWLRDEYDVACLPGGTAIVQEIHVLEPDLVLLDAHMPGVDGFEICRRLRSEGNLDLPVLFLTGSETDEDFLLHLQSGGSRYLTKPITRKELLSALTEQLAQTAA
jgi:CheY-like chemotaxis protein